MTALLIGISGGSGSGKSRLAKELADRLGDDRVSLLPFDAYYKDLRDLSMAERDAVNFDQLSAVRNRNRNINPNFRIKRTVKQCCPLSLIFAFLDAKMVMLDSATLYLFEYP